MLKPQRIKTEPWTDFLLKSYFLFTDSFLYDKLLTLKVNSKVEKSTAYVKGSITADKGAPKISDQVKFWFQ